MTAREGFNRTLRVEKNWTPADFLGSTFEKTYRPYGENGRFLVLVVGPFADLSVDFAVLVDFLARRRATRLLDQRSTYPGLALALNRKALAHKFGHLASLLWTRLILGRGSFLAAFRMSFRTHHSGRPLILPNFPLTKTHST